jgi:hypothetical protein
VDLWLLLSVSWCARSYGNYCQEKISSEVEALVAAVGVLRR